MYPASDYFEIDLDNFKNMAGIRSAVVCVTLLDRLKGDQVHHMWYHLVWLASD